MLRRKTCVLGLVACLAVNSVGVAFADGDAVAKAQAAADEALKAYQAGDYAKAISLYLESYKQYPSAETLYNIASIYDKKLHERDLAIEYYRRCSASSDASADLVGKATARVAALTKEKESESASAKPAPAPAAAPAATPGPEKPEASEGSGMRTVGWVTGGLGLVALGVGGFFGLSARSHHADATSGGCTNGMCTSADAADSERSAANAARLSTISFVVGGVLAAGGIALVLFAPSSKSEGPKTGAIRLAPMVDRATAGVSLSTIFF